MTARHLIGCWVLGILLVGFGSPGAASAQVYWYETYQHTVELINAGKFDEAAPLLVKLIEKKPAPAFGVLLPGNQCIDYSPYFQLARVLHGQGSTTAALHFLDVAEAFGEMSQNKKDRAELGALRQQLMRQDRSPTAGAEGPLSPNIALRSTADAPVQK